MDKADMVRNNVKCVRNDVTRRKTRWIFSQASSSRKKTDAPPSAPFALSFFFLSVLCWVLPFFFLFFLFFFWLFFLISFFLEEEKEDVNHRVQKKRDFSIFDGEETNNDFEMRVGMWTPEDAQRLKQGTLLQTPREEEALKKIPPLLEKRTKSFY